MTLFDLVEYCLAKFRAFGGPKKRKMHFGNLRPNLKKVSSLVNLDLRKF